MPDGVSANVRAEEPEGATAQWVVFWASGGSLLWLILTVATLLILELEHTWWLTGGRLNFFLVQIAPPVGLLASAVGWVVALRIGYWRRLATLSFAANALWVWFVFVGVRYIPMVDT